MLRIRAVTTQLHRGNAPCESSQSPGREAVRRQRSTDVPSRLRLWRGSETAPASAAFQVGAVTLPCEMGRARPCGARCAPDVSGWAGAAAVSLPLGFLYGR